jgi:hypothetical protein
VQILGVVVYLLDSNIFALTIKEVVGITTALSFIDFWWMLP